MGFAAFAMSDVTVFGDRRGNDLRRHAAAGEAVTGKGTDAANRCHCRRRERPTLWAVALFSGTAKQGKDCGLFPRPSMFSPNAIHPLTGIAYGPRSIAASSRPPDKPT
jgi:hypothetical protein